VVVESRVLICTCLAFSGKNNYYLLIMEAQLIFVKKFCHLLCSYTRTYFFFFCRILMFTVFFNYFFLIKNLFGNVVIKFTVFLN
jgi:hypothetical protein